MALFSQHNFDALYNCSAGECEFELFGSEVQKGMYIPQCLYFYLLRMDLKPCFLMPSLKGRQTEAPHNCLLSIALPCRLSQISAKDPCVRSGMCVSSPLGQA